MFRARARTQSLIADRQIPCLDGVLQAGGPSLQSVSKNYKPVFGSGGGEVQKVVGGVFDIVLGDVAGPRGLRHTALVNAKEDRRLEFHPVDVIGGRQDIASGRDLPSFAALPGAQ